MTKRFDELSAAALGNLDAELSHIAETEQISAEQSARIAVQAMQKAGFAEQEEKPVIRHRKRTKFIGALIAAALSVTVLAAGVGGYMQYNKKLMEKRFGVLGTAKLEELNVPAPVSYSNGKVKATVEAVLSDGNRAMALITYATVDPDQKIDWDLQLRETDTGEIRGVGGSNSMQKHGNECLQTLMLGIPEEGAPDTYTVRYQKTETNLPTEEQIKLAKEQGEPISDLYDDPALIGKHEPYFNDLTDGLEIKIPLAQNVPVLTLRADDGSTVQLSGFELFARRENILDFSWEEYGDEILMLYRSDGSVAKTGMQHGSGSMSSNQNDVYSEMQFAELIDGVKYKSGKPDTYIGFTDVSDITAIKLAGTMYHRIDG